MERWVKAISAAWARGAANTLALARLACQARDQLPRGEWSRLWKSGRLPFSKRKADMLVTTVVSLIAEGVVHPGLTLREACVLVAKHHPVPAGTERLSLFKQRVGPVCRRVQKDDAFGECGEPPTCAGCVAPAGCGDSVVSRSRVRVEFPGLGHPKDGRNQWLRRCGRRLRRTVDLSSSLN